MRVLNKPLRGVLLGAHSQYRGLFNAIAMQLKESFGTAVHLYCATSQERDYYSSRYNSCFDSITIDNSLHAGCSEPVTQLQAVIREAHDNEKTLGVTYNQLAMSDRHLGRGYALGGFKHPRSRLSQNTEYPQILQGYSRAIKFWRGEIEAKQPELIINCGKVAAVVSRAKGLQYRTLASSRYRNLHYWAINEFLENPAVEASYLRLTNANDIAIGAPYDAHLQMRGLMARSFTLRGTLKAMASTAARHTYWRLRGYEKASLYD
jgi:hypothetical protein